MSLQNKINNNLEPKTPGWLDVKGKTRLFLKSAKELKGDPTYVARGMAIGVFIGVTPTIPFHTAIAITLALILRASKPAAIVGVWFANPLTIPFFYYGSYKMGALLFGLDIPSDLNALPVSELLKMGFEVTAAVMCGGIIIGAPFGIAAFFITRFVFQRVQSRRKTRQDRIEQSPDSNHDIA